MQKFFFTKKIFDAKKFLMQENFYAKNFDANKNLIKEYFSYLNFCKKIDATKF